MLKLPEDNERARLALGFAFGFSVLFVYFILSLSLAFGKVTKDTSYGLDMLLQAMASLGSLFCAWAFSQKSKD